MKTGKALIEAIKKVKVHQIPKEKKPKGPDISNVYYFPPTLHLDTKDLPGIKDWNPGSTVQLAITATVGSVQVNKKEDGKEIYSTHLDITAIGDITPKVGGGK